MRILGFEERESNKQPTDDIQNELSKYVLGFPPVALCIANKEFLDLVYPRCSEFGTESGFQRRATSALGVDRVDPCLDVYGFFRFFPDGMPIEFACGRCSSTYDVEHILRAVIRCQPTLLSVNRCSNSRVLFRETFSRTILLEIVDESGCVVSEISKVYSLPALAEK